MEFFLFRACNKIQLGTFVEPFVFLRCVYGARVRSHVVLMEEEIYLHDEGEEAGERAKVADLESLLGDTIAGHHTRYRACRIEHLHHSANNAINKTVVVVGLNYATKGWRPGRNQKNYLWRDLNPQSGALSIEPQGRRH